MSRGALVRRLLAIALVLGNAGSARSQSMNLDIGTAAGLPSSSYGAAAGSPGAWNLVDMSGPKNAPIALHDLAGVATSVTVEYNAKGNGNAGFDHPLTLGDDGALLDDLCDVGGAVTSKVKYTFRGLCSGAYDVYAYAWAPDAPTAAITGVEVMGGSAGVQACGGADWTGAHVVGETYVNDTVVVTDGEIKVRFTQDTGSARANGIQIVMRPQCFNIDVGTLFGLPSGNHGGAAVSSGVWNVVDMTGPVDTGFPLVDLEGVVSAATIEFDSGGSGNYGFDNPLTTGDDELLLDDVCDLGNSSANPVKFTVRGLCAGSYRVYAYAWAPDDPVNYETEVLVLNGAAGAQTCGGGDWSGAHVPGETYVVDTATVANGVLRVRFTPRTGFGSVNGLQIVDLAGGCGASTAYCTAGYSASGCGAATSSAGAASASAPSGFWLLASGVEGAKDGLFYFGANGRQANPWGNGTSYQCVAPPVTRGGLLAGAGTTGLCDGGFAQDLNALWTAAPAKNPGAGAVVQAQLWYRDPANTSNQTTSLSDALEFCVGP